MLTNRKVLKGQYPVPGFGFEVQVVDPPFIEFRGEKIVDVGIEAMRPRLLRTIVERRGALTGAHVKFVRQSLKMSQVEFAEALGVTHPAVVKWERAYQSAARMAPSTAQSIRLLVVERFLRETLDPAQMEAIRAASLDNGEIGAVVIEPAALRGAEEPKLCWCILPGGAAAGHGSITAERLPFDINTWARQLPANTIADVVVVPGILAATQREAI